MAFVHSLVRTDVGGKTGWCAPAELAEAAPHYISFVVPVDPTGDFFSRYTCETIVNEGKRKRTESHALVKSGPDSFTLRLGKLKLWFTVTAVPKDERRLPYAGKLGHEDFALMLAEIEPEDPASIDKLFEEDSTCVIGCDAFTHYSGIKRLTSHR